MGNGEEVEQAGPELSKIENQLELTDNVKAKLDQSRSEITSGDYSLAELNG